jgi:hypothetical protein
VAVKRPEPTRTVTVPFRSGVKPSRTVTWTRDVDVSPAARAGVSAKIS